MCANEPEIHHAIRIVDPDHETKLVARDVEYGPAIPENGRVPKLRFEFCRSCPISFGHLRKPILKRRSGARVRLPEPPECAFRDNSHRLNLPTPKTGASPPLLGGAALSYPPAASRKRSSAVSSSSQAIASRASRNVARCSASSVRRRVAGATRAARSHTERLSSQISHRCHSPVMSRVTSASLASGTDPTSRLATRRECGQRCRPSSRARASSSASPFSWRRAFASLHPWPRGRRGPHRGLPRRPGAARVAATPQRAGRVPSRSRSRQISPLSWRAA